MPDESPACSVQAATTPAGAVSLLGGVAEACRCSSASMSPGESSGSGGPARWRRANVVTLLGASRFETRHGVPSLAPSALVSLLGVVVSWWQSSDLPVGVRCVCGVRTALVVCNEL